MMLAEFPRPSPSPELYGPSCGLRAEDVFPCSNAGTASGGSSTVSMLSALRLLQDGSLAGSVDFTAFFFLTDAVTVGGSLLVPSQQRGDDLSGLNATLRRLDGDSGLLELSGGVYPALPGASTALLPAVTHLRAEQLKAAAFQLPASGSSCSCLSDPHERFRRALRRVLLAAGGTPASCSSDAPALNWAGLSGQLTLVVGPMVLRSVSVLGLLDGVLLLESGDGRRVYFVSTPAVSLLG